MTMGTLYLAQTCMSCSSRSLLLCTIWLMANGAGRPVGVALSQAASVSVISASQSSSCAAGRALSAGMEPTMPALHCSITSFGVADDEQGRADDGQRGLCNTGGKGGHGGLQIDKIGLSALFIKR